MSLIKTKHVLSLAFVVVCLAFQSENQATTTIPPISFIGDITCEWGLADCNPCVSDVLTNFNEIERYESGEKVKLRIESQDHNVGNGNDLNEGYHIQGMARIAGVGDNNWIVFSRSEYEDPATIFIGELGDVDSPGGHWGAHNSANDTERTIRSSAIMSETSDYPFTVDHYGGFQMVGTYLFVGADCEKSDYCNGSGSRIDIYDLSDPMNPVLADSFDPDDSAGSVAAVRLSNGYYFVMVSYGHFFISDQETINSDTNWDLLDEWSHESELNCGSSTGPENCDWHDYQNINFVTECGTGDLYLVATARDDDYTMPQDWADLFYLTQTSGTHDVEITKMDDRHMYCDEDSCNFAASGNIYITPEGNMVLYSSTKEEEDTALDMGEEDNDIVFQEFQNQTQIGLCNNWGDAACDDDGDGLTNQEESENGTNPDSSDSDGDGLNDNEEISTYGTDPLDVDSDDDNFEDGSEISHGWDPLDASDPKGKIATILTNYLFDDSACISPNSGSNWTITRDCILQSSQSWSGDLYIQDGAVMTIPSGIVLDLDFSQKKLAVENGSGVLILQGGKVY